MIDDRVPAAERAMADARFPGAIVDAEGPDREVAVVRIPPEYAALRADGRALVLVFVLFTALEVTRSAAFQESSAPPLPILAVQSAVAAVTAFVLGGDVRRVLRFSAMMASAYLFAGYAGNAIARMNRLPVHLPNTGVEMLGPCVAALAGGVAAWLLHRRAAAVQP